MNKVFDKNMIFLKYIAIIFTVLITVTALSSCSMFNSNILPAEDTINKLTIESMDANTQANPEGQLFSLPVSVSTPDTGRLFYILNSSLYAIDKQMSDSKIVYILRFYNSNNEEVLKLGVMSNDAVAIFAQKSVQYTERGVFEDFISELRIVNAKYGILNTI